VDFLLGAPVGEFNTVQIFGYCDSDGGVCPMAPGSRICIPVTLQDAGTLFAASQIAPTINAMLEGELVAFAAPWSSAP
jgi:hypothetical protein